MFVCMCTGHSEGKNTIMQTNSKPLTDALHLRRDTLVQEIVFLRVSVFVCVQVTEGTYSTYHDQGDRERNE